MQAGGGRADKVCVIENRDGYLEGCLEGGRIVMGDADLLLLCVLVYMAHVRWLHGVINERTCLSNVCLS